MDAPVIQRLPSTGPVREALREKGQFWTPDWVADAMVAWATCEANLVFDPAAGAGAFFRAAKRLSARSLRPIGLRGAELDQAQVREGIRLGLSPSDYADVAIGDFMDYRPDRPLPAIVANPPYVRHHRFGAEYKARLRTDARLATGCEIDGRAGLHVFFLIRALTLLAPGGRLAFILPADICEGRFAPPLWSWIAKRFRIEGAVTFAPHASPFPGVDTNPVVLLIRNAPPSDTLSWAHVTRPGTADLLDWCERGLGAWSSPSLGAVERNTGEAVSTGLTRRPLGAEQAEAVALGSFLRVMRGIATGDNDFFFMDSRRIAQLGLPEAAFMRAIGRTRDHDGPWLGGAHLDALDHKGRPTYLLSLGREPIGKLSPALQRYLRLGEERGLPGRPLLAQRSPWYRMEQRQPPPWLFAYLGRRNCRFIRNEAGAVPLTGFLCVYPKEGVRLDMDAATRVLNDERTIANLSLVAKSYGSGALKVEPRSLERLPIPCAVFAEHGLALTPQVRLL